MEDHQHTGQLTTTPPTREPLTRRSWWRWRPLPIIGAGIGGLALGAILTATLSSAPAPPPPPAGYATNLAPAVTQAAPADGAMRPPAPCLPGPRFRHPPPPLGAPAPPPPPASAPAPPPPAAGAPAPPPPPAGAPAPPAE